MTDSSGPVAPARGVLRPLPAPAARLGGLLGDWQERNATATLPHCIENLGRSGNLANLRRVTGEAGGEFTGFWFADTDVYKTLEAAAWELGRGGPTGDALRRFLAETAALLARAQDPDGYLDSYYQVDHRDKQWTELHFSHEMYCAGHLIQAAVAAARSAPGDPAAEQVVTVARRLADLLVERFGPGGTDALDGHPEVETALVELYRLTGHRPYLELAARFIDLRGHGLVREDRRLGARYYVDHAPVRTAEEVTGHAVRQLYLLAGAVDVAVETGDDELLAATERLWDSALGTKTYLTGGQGSRHRDEAFGDPYELPPDRAYAETCAAIGSFQWAWRLLLATGKARYADEMERVLYNGIAASTGLDGRSFFYSNPLQLRTGHDGSHEDAPSQRLPWYSCACCPPNLARLMASLHTYVATGDDTGLQLHLYAAGSFTAAGQTVEVSTDYPWDEKVTVTVTAAADAEWTLALRVPAWCADVQLSVNGSLVRTGAQEGYLRLTRAWRAGDRVELTLAMPPRLVAAHPRVDAVRGTAAAVRGPLVYCLEQADLPAHHGVLEDLALDPARPIAVRPADGVVPVFLDLGVRARTETPELYPPLAAGATTGAASTVSATTGAASTVSATTGAASTVSATTGAASTVSAIPYFLWANRDAGPMRVWIPLAPQVE